MNAEIFTAAAMVIFGYMTFLFVIAAFTRNNSVADTGWGIGFIAVTLTTLVIAGEISGVKLLTAALVTVWGMRLAVRIFLRNRGRGEDFRYRKMRQGWGRAWLLNSYFRVPIVLINKAAAPPFGLFTAVGAVIWLAGFVIEVTADYQLDRFIAGPQDKGKVLQSGLWCYSRHPNYFGEVVQWWGIFAIALGVEYGWAGIIGPVTITFLILKVSGIPMLEKTLSQNPEYVDYQRRTSSFIPLPPKKG
jgi:steroid 5-alpha reductase family enzyme